MQSTKPYLIRAIHEWCADQGLTPYLTVSVDPTTRVPREFVKDGVIVLNVGVDATHQLLMGNEDITFQARFGGRAFPVVVPIERIAAIYARENGEGMAFDVTERSGVDAVASDGKIQDKLPQDYAADGDSVVGSLVERETASGVPSSTPISDRASGRPILTRVK